MMNTEQERKGFEEWAKGEMIDNKAVTAWGAWQARASQIKPLPVEAIADAILNASSEGPATRIELRRGQKVSEEINLGGLNRDGLIGVLRALLGESK